MDTTEGLLYYASEGGTTMELAGEKLLVKYRASKFIDWKTLSDMLFKEVSDLAEWGFRQMENKVESLSPIGKEKRRQDAYLPFFIYLVFHERGGRQRIRRVCIVVVEEPCLKNLLW